MSIDVTHRVAWIFRQERKRTGAHQATIAKAVGLTQSSWQRMETGRSALTIDQFVVACKALKLSPVAVMKSVVDPGTELND